MKVLSFSRISLVCALLLGAMTLWVGAAPRLISGERVEGGTGCCNGVFESVCVSKPDKTCNDYSTKCNTTGNDDCLRLGSSSCYLRLQCENESDYMCNG